MTLTYNGRLPGVVCETTLPTPTEAPLRLDVAAFVGFAERGPLDTPIALEDIRQYRDVFGDDLLVARDEDGRPVYANLPPAVEAFFDNGGRRCYVVRVAGEDARPNRFRLPGLVTWNPVDGFRPVIAPAAWVGQWSDRMSVGTQLQTTPFRVTAYRPASAERPEPEVDLELPDLGGIRPGDLIRVHFDAPVEVRLVFRVAKIIQQGLAATTRRGVPVTAIAESGTVLAFSPSLEMPLPLPQTVERLGELGWEMIAGSEAGLETDEVGNYVLTLPIVAVLHPGDLLRVSCLGGKLLYFPVVEVGWNEIAMSPPSDPGQRLISREALWQATTPAAPATPDQAELLRFDLFIRESDDTLEHWLERRFDEGPDGWLEGLAQPVAEVAPLTAGQLLRRSTRLGAPEATSPAPFFLPLGMSALPGVDTFSGPLPEEEAASSPPSSAPGKDGLDRFEPVALFLDLASGLPNSGVRSLLQDAEQLLYLSRPPVRLRGLYSLISIDEIGLIALPDLVHRPWTQPTLLSAEPAPEPESEPSLDWSYFRQCLAPEPPPPPPEPGLPEHAPCDQPFALISSQAETEVLDPRRQLARLPVLTPPAAYDPTDLLTVQQALVTLCAARADLVAVLSLPHHFERRAVLEWQQQVRARPDFREGNALSYAAVYHPWLQIRELATPELAPLRAVPADGAVCGLIAARELARGPWIAPANVALRNVVGLTPTLSQPDWTVLFDAQVNLLHQQPGRFTPLSAHTLSFDPLLVQISVRRLLIFLRKLALRRGMRYVFESNNERFRQRVQGAFEQTLGVLTTRGALTAFQVVTGDGLNTPNDIDNGRFLIALKVAPTYPIEFMTIILLRAGEGLLDVVVR